MPEPSVHELRNSTYHVAVRREGDQIHVRLHDRKTDFDFADGTYVYRAVCPGDEGSIISEYLWDSRIRVEGDTINISGKLAGLDLEHRLWLPSDRPLLEERITLRNGTAQVVALRDLACGMQRDIADETGQILPEVAADRFVAIPFRHRAADPSDWDNDFDASDLLTYAGQELRPDVPISGPEGFGYVPSSSRFSEGWAWTHGEHTLGVFKFNQAAMEFSSLALAADEVVRLRFGGVGMRSDEPASLRHIPPGQTLELGVTRFATVEGGYREAYYAFRGFLDENGCRFPPDYDPPVHWNELYDNPEWSLGTPGRPPGPRMTRPLTYTRSMLMQEAAKARDFGCEALYLDPGWDTDFGTFLWGEQWLGNRGEFISELRAKYGLGLALHCPLAPWLSEDGRGVSAWPAASFRADRDGTVIEGSVCLGSRQYLDEAERRLLEDCADGVVFLMFDGNTWPGECWNPDHGHPVPYTMEDHCGANLELARRIHAKYPQVLVEMHDMIAAGRKTRFTPVYYKYGLPGSYDENWGFELMWQPMEDILAGRARALYYYNLGCNIPIYLHVDLRGDNEHALVFWWYASTCRHLGIGGTHENPMIAETHRQAMKRYRRLDRFYKRGEFYGLSEEVHVHALPDENAFVVNVFNLSDQSRIVSGTVVFDEIGLDRDQWYVSPFSHAEGGFDAEAGTYRVSRRLAPWSAQIVEVRALAAGSGE